jgi:hypothetical protein
MTGVVVAKVYAEQSLLLCVACDAVAAGLSLGVIETCIKYGSVTDSLNLRQDSATPQTGTGAKFTHTGREQGSAIPYKCMRLLAVERIRFVTSSVRLLACAYEPGTRT